MTTTPSRTTSNTATVLDRLHSICDAMTVKRIFGEPIERDGTTVIPVAAVRSAGGGGEGTGPGGGATSGTSSGGGLGFAVSARPLGVYELRDGSVRWHPMLDVQRLVITIEIAVIGAIVIARGRHRRRTSR